MHRSMNPAVARRREREYEATSSPAEFQTLLARWQREDAELERAENLQGKQIAELRQRMRGIEAFLFNKKLDGLSEELIDLLGHILADLRRSINNDKIAKLKREIEDLKRSRVKYCGVFEYGTLYHEGSMVTRGGSIWYATKETREAPGEGQTSWTLAVKKGGAV
jgi:hypothetical protein